LIASFAIEWPKKKKQPLNRQILTAARTRAMRNYQTSSAAQLKSGNAFTGLFAFNHCLSGQAARQRTL
jgi:hypothetical protein